MGRVWSGMIRWRGEEDEREGYNIEIQQSVLQRCSQRERDDIVQLKK